MNDPKLSAKITQWLKWDRNERTRDEIAELIANKDFNTLQQRLMYRHFIGSSGFRGPMRAGYESMNDLVVIQTIQGLCVYVGEQFPHAKEERSQRGLVIGYDCRNNSRHFAELAATICLQRGFKTFFYSKLVTTPFIAFSVVALNCAAGIMITASHNSKEDNGIKIFWSNGALLAPPISDAVERSILQNLEPWVGSWNTRIVEGHKLLVDPYATMFETYIDELVKLLPESFMEINKNSHLHFVYTPLHGVALPFIQAAFKRFSLRPLILVDKQKDPDPEFPTVESPNPEEGKDVFEMAIKTASSYRIPIVIVNDADGDRLGVAEKTEGRWKIYTGNELGALLGWWALMNHSELYPGKSLINCYMLASALSSQILKAISNVEGFQYVETLPGFNFMGNRAADLLEKQKEVLFAFEESNGFMFGVTTFEKDGVSAACHLATMACFLKKNGNITLHKKLNQIYKKYGFHISRNSYFTCKKQEIIKSIFHRLRNYQRGRLETYPTSIRLQQTNEKFAVSGVRDLNKRLDTTQPNGIALLPAYKNAQMITFYFENGASITLRTSETDPQIKYYAEWCGKPGEGNWTEMRTKLDNMVVAAIGEFLQPGKWRDDLQPQK